MMVSFQFTFYALLAASMVISAPASLLRRTNAALPARETYELGIRADAATSLGHPLNPPRIVYDPSRLRELKALVQRLGNAASTEVQKTRLEPIQKLQEAWGNEAFKNHLFYQMAIVDNFFAEKDKKPWGDREDHKALSVGFSTAWSNLVDGPVPHLSAEQWAEMCKKAKYRRRYMKREYAKAVYTVLQAWRYGGRINEDDARWAYFRLKNSEDDLEVYLASKPDGKYLPISHPKRLWQWFKDKCQSLDRTHFQCLMAALRRQSGLLLDW